VTQTETSRPLVIVLAAGKSERLWPLRDKALVRIGKMDLLQRHLTQLADLGIRDAVVVCNVENEADLRASVAAMAGPVACRFATQDQTLPGMGGAVLAARAALGGETPGAAFITQAHDVTAPSLHASMLKAWSTRPETGLLAGWHTPPGEYFPGGYLVLDAAPGDSMPRITAVIEKPGPDNVPPGRLVTIVAHLHPDFDRLCQAIRREYAVTPNGPDDHYERAMSGLFGELEYRAVQYTGPWHALKYPWHMLAITRFFLSSLEGVEDEGASVSPGANVVGPVHLGKGARILWGADVKGPAWIGAGALVGQFAQVRESFIGDGCVVGIHSEVNRSYVGDGATMHAGRVLDSVIAQTPPGMTGANVSAGVITANLRIDHGIVSSRVKGERIDTGLDKLGAVIGAGAFISIQAGTMPGVKLGEGSIVYPGVIVQRDVKAGETYGRPSRAASPLAKAESD
jgi:NDP-sugar pyrophosphorylase family protein